MSEMLIGFFIVTLTLGLITWSLGVYYFVKCLFKEKR